MTIRDFEKNLANEGTSVDDLRERVDVAIDACLTAVARFESALTAEHAEEACLACRTAVQLLFFARGDFGELATSRTSDLVSALRRSEMACEKLAVSEGENSIVWDYRDNIATRQSLLDALLKDDAKHVRKLLKDELAKT